MISPALTEFVTEAARSFAAPALLINLASNSTSDISGPVCDIFHEYGLAEPSVSLAHADDFIKTLDTVIAQEPDLLMIYGGDGSCNAAAIAAKAAGIPILPLPGGTMNLLPKAVYDTTDWESALRAALTQGSVRWQATGQVNGIEFLCGAIIGDPTIMSETREAIREGEILTAVKQIPDIIETLSDGTTFEFKADGKTFDKASNILQLSCPGMSSGATHSGRFEIASVPQLSVPELLGIGAVALADDWRASRNVTVSHARTVSITGQGQFDILLDGEPTTVECPIKMTLNPDGVQVLAPSDSVPASPSNKATAGS